MTALRTLGGVLMLLLLIGCVSGPPRAHARYIYTHHAVLFVDDAGRGGYLLELHPIRRVPPLAELRVHFERPDGSAWSSSMTVQPGERRYRFASPYFDGFDPTLTYVIRIELLDLDRLTRLDRLRQRVQVTPAGAHDR